MFNIIGADMPFNMMDPYQRDPGRKADGFGGRHPYKKSPYQSRAISHRNGVHIRKRFCRIGQGLFNHLIYFFYVLAGGNFRHHAAILRVQGNLGVNHIGEHFPSVFYHCGRRLVTGAFNCQYINVLFHHFSSFSTGCQP